MIKFNIIDQVKCCAHNLNSPLNNKIFIVCMENCLRRDLAFMRRPRAQHIFSFLLSPEPNLLLFLEVEEADMAISVILR